MAQTVIGIFKNSTEAQNAREHMLKNGFSDDRIDVAAQSATNYSGDTMRTDQDEDFGDRVGRFFRNLFGDDEEATSYTRAATHGTVVTVHALSAEEAESAADILDDYGAVDVNEYAAAYGSNMGQTSAGTTTSSEMDRMGGINSGRTGVTDSTDMDSDRISGIREDMDTDISNRTMDSDRLTSDMDRDTDRTDNRENTSIPIIEENITVGKKDVITGGKRIHSRIVERPVEETVRLREEHVNVERKTVDREATEQDISNFKEGTIEVTEHKEVPVVDKESRIVEEVNVFKDVEETQEVVRETLRNTEVDTDDITASNDRRETDDLDDLDRDKHRDDIHRQRPGII